MAETHLSTLWDQAYFNLDKDAASDSLYREMIVKRDKPFRQFLVKEVGRFQPLRPVLDVGANLFSFSYLPHKDVVAVNFSFNGLTHELSDPVNADGLVLPFKDGVFPVVLSKNTYGYIAKPEQLINEMFRVLKPKGKFILIDMAGAIKQYNQDVPGTPPRMSDFYPDVVAAGLPLDHIKKTTLFEGNLRLSRINVPLEVVAITGIKR